jgi:carbonic anhydrase
MIIPSISTQYLKRDIPASLAVFVVAIPLCLGIAHASGAPLITGLIAGMAGGLIVGLFSDSNLSVSGPAAGLTAISLAGIQSLGSYQVFVAAVLCAGVLQVLFGFLKLGAVSNYIPTTVIKGMLAAIGLILIIKQFPHLIGYDIEEMGVEEFEISQTDINEAYHEKPEGHENTFSLLLHSLKHINFTVMSLGLGSIAFLFFWEKKIAKKLKLIPGTLVLVVLGMLVSYLIKVSGLITQLEPDHFVNVPEILSVSSASYFFPPDFNSFFLLGFWKIVFTIAIVASIESLLSIEAIQKIDIHRQRVDVNRELLAQGAGNIFSAALGGLPVTAVIVRGSVNQAAGARTKMSAVLHGFWILISVLFFTGILNQIPLASLAAILCFTGYKLLDPSLFKFFYKKGVSQFIPFVATILAIVFSDLLIGVSFGLIIAGFFIIKDNYNSPVLRVYDLGPRTKIILGENVSFLHKKKVTDALEAILPNTLLEIDGSRSRFIDEDILDAIVEYRKNAHLHGIEVILGGIIRLNDKKELMESIDKSYEKLFSNNKKWVEEKIHKDPAYFKKLTAGQKPEYLFIGCSDSRVPANEITGTDPGEMFVHRNIANMVVNTDINLLSVLQYSVEVLNVKHVIVCGHYGCGGVKAALENQSHGLIDKWLRNIKDAYRLHMVELDAITDHEEKHRRMVEINVQEQVINLLKTSFIQKNIELYGFPKVHGWVYDIADGYIKDLEIDPKKHFPEYGLYKID